MIEEDENSTAQQKRFLDQCMRRKEMFVQAILQDFRGEEGETHVDHAKFLQVITPAFSRPGNLRQFVLYKTKNCELGSESQATQERGSTVVRAVSLKPE